jgi:hypothetical protein
MRIQRHLIAALAGTLTLAACDNQKQLATDPGTPNAADLDAGSADVATLKVKDDAQIVRATGDIAGAVKQFRDLLGDPNPNVPGEQPGNRREVNWDGVGAGTRTTSVSRQLLQHDLAARRPVQHAVRLFRISNNGYIDINPNYANEFNAFSAPRLFVARGSTITDVNFVVAGSNTPATVTGFGAVFADVGRAHSTRIEFYDVSGNRLLTIAAPRRSDDRGLSFAGANFTSRIVARVRVISGDTPIGPDDNVHSAGKKRDVVRWTTSSTASRARSTDRLATSSRREHESSRTSVSSVALVG